MKKTLAIVSTAIIVVIAFGLPTRFLRAVADDAKVKAKPERVIQNDKIDNADTERMNAHQTLRLGQGNDKVKVISMTFIPPGNDGEYYFRNFEGDEKQDPLAIYQYVDFAKTAKDFGVVADENGLVEGPKRIKVYAFYPNWFNADVFPMKVEGNLTRIPGVGFGKLHWSVEVLPTEPQAMLRLVRWQEFRLRSDREIKVECKAIGWEGNEIAIPVGVQVNLYQDGNGGQNAETQPDWPLNVLLPMAAADRATEAPMAASTQWILRAKHTANPPAYSEAELKVPIVSAQWVERSEPYRGFDPTENPPWIVLEEPDNPQANTSSTAAQLRIDASLVGGDQLPIVVSNPAKADRTPTQTNTNPTNATITGKQKGDTDIVVSKNNVPIARLNVNVKPRRNIEVRFIFLFDNANPKHESTAAEIDHIQESWIATANEVWRPQAIIRTTEAATIGEFEITENMGTEPNLGGSNGIWAKLNASDNAAHHTDVAASANQNIIHVYVIWDFNFESAAGVTHVDKRKVYIKTGAGGLAAR